MKIKKVAKGDLKGYWTWTDKDGQVYYTRREGPLIRRRDRE